MIQMHLLTANVEIMTNKKIQAIIKELFIRCRKLNISLAFLLYSLHFLFQKMSD